MATPRSKPQTISFVPQGTNQAKGTRTLPLGALVEATNVRQTKEDEWRKRLGFGRTVPTDTGGTYSGGGSNMQSVYAGALVERDAVGQFWAYDSTGANRRRLGIHPASFTNDRPFPTYQDAGITLSGVRDTGPPRRSVVVLGASNDLWTFTVGDGKFQYAVIASDGSVRKAATSVTHTNIEQLAAVYHPGQSRVYVLAMTSVGTAVTAFSYNATTYASVTSATYHSGMTGITSLDMQYLSSPAEVAVVVAQYDSGTPRCRVTQSYLDPATLAPKGSPAAVNFDVTPNANRPDTCGGVSILIGTGLTSWYYSFWRASATANQLQLMLVTVTTSTLASASSQQLDVVATAAGADWRGVTSGYVDTGNGNRVVYAQPINPDSATAWSYDWDVTRYTWNGSSTTTLVVAKGAWLASKPCRVGSIWYFLTGRDSGYNYGGAGGGTYANFLGRTGDVYLRDSDGNILSQVLSSVAIPVWHRSTSHENANLGLTQINQYDQFVTTLVSPGASKLAAGLGRSGETTLNFPPALVTWDFTATCGPPAAYGELALFPGPIPLVCGPKDFLREMFPLHAPPTPRGTLGGALTASVCATYRFRDSSGRAYESSPSPSLTESTFSSTSTATVATLKHAVGSNAEICIYATASPGGSILLLQSVVPNSTSVNSVTVPIWNIVTDFPEITPLHTNGGGLSNAVLPPCRNVALWRDRLHLSGTPTEGEVWHSQEIVEGLAPTFNEVLRSFWQDAQGPILGLKPVDWNYLAGFKRNGVGVIGGPGPDGRGQGAYVWQTLNTEKGLSDAALNSLLSTPYGAAFQNEADGRICLVTTGLQVQDIMQGADSYRSLTVGATLLNEPDRQAWFYCTDGKLLVLEYAWAGETKKLVECWRKWSSSGLLRAYGAVMTPSGPLHIESNGVIRAPAPATWRDATSSSPADYSHAIETGRLAPFGLLMEGGVVGAHILGENIDSDGDSVLQVDIYPDDSLVPSSHEIFPVTSTPMDYSMKPTGCFRCKEVRVRIEEFTAGNIEGTVLHGVALDVVPYGRTRILPVGQRIA